MENAILFPFLPSTLPIARHFNSMQSAYHISAVLAHRGMGLTGKDAATICNQPPVGIPTLNQLNYEDSNWSTLVVDHQSLSTIESRIDPLNIFSQCLNAGKKIVFVCDSITCVDSYLVDLSTNFSGQIQFLTSDMSVKKPRQYAGQYMPVSVPVMLVGGLISTYDSLEVLLSIKESFAMKDVHVSCITASNISLLFGMHSFSHIFNNADITEAEKMLQLNQLVTHIIQSERPQLILIEAPDPVLKYNNIVANGFGIRTYMVSQVMDPDYFICCMPSGLIDYTFVNGISLGLQKKYGFPISAIHSTNEIVDVMSLLEDEVVSSVHINMEEVSAILEKIPEDFPLPVANLLSHDKDNIYQYICDALV